MANAVEAQWHGHDYQARIFWMYAARLRDPDHPNVAEVTYEGDGPKSFDDVIVRYDPPRRSQTNHQISADYHQIKYHVTGEGRFGYKDLIDPVFIGAKRFSILERLKNAKIDAPDEAAFTLITTDRIADGDVLGALVSSIDHSLRLDRLSVGSTDNSKMGEVRKCWREHLGLKSDDDLLILLRGLHIKSGYSTLDELREQVNLNFRLVGLIGCEDAMEFRFDAAARALKTKGINRLDRESFEKLVQQEKWEKIGAEPHAVGVAIQSFAGATPRDSLQVKSENDLQLLDHFNGRALKDGHSWQADILPQITSFLHRIIATNKRLRLYLDAHASIAFLCGDRLGLKSGTWVELVQMGQRGFSIWRADDGKIGGGLNFVTETLSDKKDIAIAISLSRDTAKDVKTYVESQLSEVGKFITVVPKTGNSQQFVEGGAHAARLAEDIAAAVVQVRSPGATIHIFVAAPNAFSFFFGQHAAFMGECITYEFDFGGRVDGSYRPTFRI